MALVIKNLPANADNRRDATGSLDPEDALEEDMATHSNILPWRIPWTEEPGRLSPYVTESDRTEQLSMHASYLILNPVTSR